jgi:hypothetical protein
VVVRTEALWQAGAGLGFAFTWPAAVRGLLKLEAGMEVEVELEVGTEVDVEVEIEPDRG